ncbi:MAG: acyl-CoA desaturase [Acidimicrobiia bacterium]|nr:acyl-CoA desaturase [Acidimicrobiia bacterium]
MAVVSPQRAVAPSRSSPPPARAPKPWAEQVLTAAIVFGPLVAIVAAASALWNHGISVRDALTAIVFYLVAGFGITVGYHRLFTHRSFRAVRPLRIALAVAGSFAVEGGVIGWVANHRRHHAFADREGDPHSPTSAGSGARTALGGLWHAHVGWLFKPTFAESMFAKDVRADRDLRIVDRLFPVFAVMSFLAPFALGWGLTGTIRGGIVTLLWAGVLRIFLLHHVTWSINSICHTFGSRPWTTRDRSTNVAVLAPLSFGESWHNAHHADPRAARYGVTRRQVDPGGALIAMFERLGWASDVEWRQGRQLGLHGSGF